MSNPKKIAHWDAKGLLSAGLVVSAWAAVWVVLLQTPLTPAAVAVGIPLQTFLYTGLFITAHDAMHGTVTPSYSRINRVVGWISVLLYALFSLKKLTHEHMLHHAHPGEPGHDPDFHDGERPEFVQWYMHFLKHYVSFWQMLGMAVVFNVLEHLAHIALPNLILFWVLPSLLSTLQLFYFGTYLPHRGDPGNVHHARSNAFRPSISFLTCYHFGYHLEHHESPWAPWWHLPVVRASASEPKSPPLPQQ